MDPPWWSAEGTSLVRYVLPGGTREVAYLDANGTLPHRGPSVPGGEQWSTGLRAVVEWTPCSGRPDREMLFTLSRRVAQHTVDKRNGTADQAIPFLYTC